MRVVLLILCFVVIDLSLTHALHVEIVGGRWQVVTFLTVKMIQGAAFFAVLLSMFSHRIVKVIWEDSND